MEQKLNKKGKSRKKLYLLGALALVLALTGSMFAYTYTTASVQIGAIADSEYAEVGASTPPLQFPTRVFGKFRGDLPTGNLFEITPDGDYTGDLLTKVYLTNADDLTGPYQHLNMILELQDVDGNILSVDWTNEYLDARNAFGTSVTDFASAEQAYRDATNAMTLAKDKYVASPPTIDIADFLIAVDQYNKAVARFQTEIVTHQEKTDRFVAIVTTYQNQAGNISAEATAFIADAGTFDSAASAFNSAASASNAAKHDYREGSMTEAEFLGAIGAFLSTAPDPLNANDTFLLAVDDWQVDVNTDFLPALDGYLTAEHIVSAGHSFQLLTLDNGVVTFDLQQSWGPSPYYIYLNGGSYTTNPRGNPLAWSSTVVEPLLFCEVTQR